MWWFARMSALRSQWSDSSHVSLRYRCGMLCTVIVVVMCDVLSEAAGPPAWSSPHHCGLVVGAIDEAQGMRTTQEGTMPCTPDDHRRWGPPRCF